MTAIESVFFVQFKIHGFIIFEYIEDKVFIIKRST